jgi:hypothetical protein
MTQDGRLAQGMQDKAPVHLVDAIRGQGLEIVFEDPMTDGADAMRRVAPRGQATPRTFTDLEKETIGLALLRKVIETDAITLTDHRGQHGLGADAQDNLGSFYELKVHLGQEPDLVRTEDS